MGDGEINLREDTGGQSPPDVSGRLEASAFDQAAAKHSLAERRLEMGLWGVLGSGENAPNLIAFLAMVLGVAVAVGCLIVSAYKVDADAKFFEGFAERSLAFSATCLGFIFGRSSNRS